VPGEESEPAAADALQPLVDALCVSIGGTAVSKLVLDAHLLHYADNTPCVYTMQCDWKYLNLVLVFILTHDK